MDLFKQRSTAIFWSLFGLCFNQQYQDKKQSMRNEWRNSKELEDKHAFFYTVDREEVWIAKLNYTFYGMRCGFCKIKRVFRFLTQASLQVKVQDNLSEMFFFFVPQTSNVFTRRQNLTKTISWIPDLERNLLCLFERLLLKLFRLPFLDELKMLELTILWKISIPLLVIAVDKL